MDMESQMRAALDSQPYTRLPDCDPWPKRALYSEAGKPVKRVLALPPPMVEAAAGEARRRAERLSAILSLDDGVQRKILLADVLREVAIATKVPVEWMKGDARWRHIVRARHIFAYVARNITGASWPALGRAINCDHSTVHHGASKVASRTHDFEPELSQVLAAFRHGRGAE